MTHGWEEVEKFLRWNNSPLEDISSQLKRSLMINGVMEKKQVGKLFKQVQLEYLTGIILVIQMILLDQKLNLMKT